MKKREISLLKVGAVCTSLIMAICLLSIFALTVGSSDYGFWDIVDLLQGNGVKSARIIIFNLRLPRIILAIIVGASLSIAGALLQAVMRNPLADPGSIGVSAGAGTAAITILLLFPHLSASVPLFAFVGATFACLLIYTMAWNGGIEPVRLILSGVAINSVLGAYNSLLQLMNSDNLAGVLGFMNGSLSGKSWAQVQITASYASVGLVLAFCCTKFANILQLGDEMAKSLGNDVNKSRILLSAVSSFLAAATVSTVGMIGFVGLVVPHIARMLVGSDYKVLLPTSTLLGAFVLLLADTIGRLIVPGVEIPVGIIMSVCGGPFFLYMLKKGGKVGGN